MREEERILFKLSERVIGAAIRVHKALGPGLLESTYEECLCYELIESGLAVERQVGLPLCYKTLNIANAYRLDLVVNESLVVEIKTVDELLRIHSAQLLTYLKLSGIQAGLLMNFNSVVLRDGIKRYVNSFPCRSVVNP